MAEKLISPLPWRVGFFQDGLAEVFDAQEVMVLKGVTLDEAYLIVRCVNSHQALVEALRIAEELLHRNGISRPEIAKALNLAQQEEASHVR